MNIETEPKINSDLIVEINLEQDNLLENPFPELNETPTENNRKRPNKTERKFEKYQRKLARYKVKKLEKKKLKTEQRTEKNEDESKTKTEESNQENKTRQENESIINKRELKKQTIERLNQVYSDPSSSLKICIDCSFSDKMSSKEMSRLAQQIGRCYATNRSVSSPIHLTLCNLDKDSKFYQELCRVNDGFARYIIQMTEKSLEENFSDRIDSIAYLSPDSETYLESLNTDNVYVIGGLVDETVNKKVTLSKCKNLKVNTYSLPIEKYMMRKPSNGSDSKIYSFNKILAINQVFDILANFFINKDWPKALECGVPKRKGFICVDEANTEKKDQNNDKIE